VCSGAPSRSDSRVISKNLARPFDHGNRPERLSKIQSSNEALRLKLKPLLMTSPGQEGRDCGRGRARTHYPLSSSAHNFTFKPWAGSKRRGCKALINIVGYQEQRFADSPDQVTNDENRIGAAQTPITRPLEKGVVHLCLRRKTVGFIAPLTGVTPGLIAYRC